MDAYALMVLEDWVKVIFKYASFLVIVPRMHLA